MEYKIILFSGIFVLAFFLTYFTKKIALRKKIIDIPNIRSSHTTPTPRGGGIAIIISWYIGLGIEFFFNNIETGLFLALLSGILVVFIGLIDDIKPVSPKIRIIVQAGAAGLALYFLGGLNFIDLGFIKLENIYILTGLAFIGIIWFINLFNFLDGIDGYAGSECIFIFLVIFVFFNSNSAMIFAVATGGFLIWNWQPAKIFMGDVGSTIIGFNVAVFAIYYQNSGTISLLTMLILSSIFWFDASWTLIRRIINRENISIAHKKHAFQRIVVSGFSHQKTVFLLIFLNIINLGLFYASYKNPRYLILFFLGSIIISYLYMKFADKKIPFS